MFAPKTNSFALVVVAAPLFAAVLLPLAPAVTSRAVTPRYSRMHISGNAAAWLNVTVTVLLPPKMSTHNRSTVATLSRSSARSPEYSYFLQLSVTDCTVDVVSFQPTTTTFRSPAICAAG